MRVECTSTGIKLIPESTLDAYEIGVMSAKCNCSVGLNSTRKEVTGLNIRCKELVKTLMEIRL
jgi:hypothetical protein